MTIKQNQNQSQEQNNTVVKFQSTEKDSAPVSFTVDEITKIINEKNDNQSIIGLALEKNLSLENIKTLIKKGAPINQYDNKNLTPLAYAFVCNRPDVAELLLESGADFNIPLFSKSKNGIKSLHEILDDSSKTERLSKEWITIKAKLEQLGAADHSDPTFIPTPGIHNLVLEGGGAKGAVYGGAYKELYQSGKLTDLKRVGGSSAGGISAFLIATGFTGPEFLEECNKLDFTKFQDINASYKITKFFRGLKNLFWDNSHGVYDGDFARNFLKEKANEKLSPFGLNGDATFADLAKLADTHPQFKQLYLTGTNLTTGKSEIFSHEHTPNMKIVDAVRITMSFPGAFKSVPMTKEDGSVHYYTDGGAMNNFPADIFDNSKYLKGTGYQLNECGNNPTTLGLRLLAPGQEHLDKPKNGDDKKGVGFFGYIGKLFGAINKSQHNDRKNSHNMIHLQSIVDTLEFDVSQEKKDEMSKMSKEAMQNWISQHKSSENYYKIEENDDVTRPEKKINTSVTVLKQELAKVHKQRDSELNNKDKDLIKIRYLNKRLVEIQHAIDLKEPKKEIKQVEKTKENNTCSGKFNKLFSLHKDKSSKKGGDIVNSSNINANNSNSSDNIKSKSNNDKMFDLYNQVMNDLPYDVNELTSTDLTASVIVNNLSNKPKLVL